MLPAAASAQSDGSDGSDVAVAEAVATLDCNLVGLHIKIDDVNGARLVCRVSGASAGDTSFSVSAVRPSGEAEQPLCTDGLNAGAGICRGGAVDLASPLSLKATLQPSGVTLGPVMIGPAPAQPAIEPMQFFPIGD